MCWCGKAAIQYILCNLSAFCNVSVVYNMKTIVKTIKTGMAINGNDTASSELLSETCAAGRSPVQHQRWRASPHSAIIMPMTTINEQLYVKGDVTGCDLRACE